MRERLLEQYPEARDLIAEIDREHERLFALFDEAPVFMSLLEGPELRITLINRRLRETAEGPFMLGKTARELYPANNPALEILDRVYETGNAETVHALPPFFASSDHSHRYFNRIYTPLRDRDGKVHAVLALGYEVTEDVHTRIAHERSQAELQRLFALLEEAPVQLAVVEPPDWRVTMANREIRKLFTDRNPVGMKLRDVITEDNPTLQAIERVAATGRSETLHMPSRIPEFRGRSFQITLVPIRDQSGAISQIMAAAIETTEQLRAREALETQARDLEIARSAAVEAGQAKDQFLAMLGHELRNPLAPMLTSLQVMRLEHEDSPALDILERQIRHLTRLVDDLLDISRITRGKLDLQHEDLDVITIVNRALEMSTPLLEQRGHRIVSELELRGLGVSGDADRLAQVVGNLLSNAAKYSDPGSEIRISARRIDERVVLAVEDRGAGIAPEMLATVFDAFVQQPQTLARSQGGLGLGLAIVKNIVLAHGGVVSAHSEGLGRGSRFVVELPAIELRAPIEQPRRERTVRPRAMPLRILVVDDNREAADILQIALEALGHTIAIAYDGPSALEISATYEPQLALIDIGLPVMDGYRLAEALHRTYNIPIVAVTGYGQDSDRLRSREAGFAAHLVKPVDLHELAELANRLCSP